MYMTKWYFGKLKTLKKKSILRRLSTIKVRSRNDWWTTEDSSSNYCIYLQLYQNLSWIISVCGLMLRAIQLWIILLSNYDIIRLEWLFCNSNAPVIGNYHSNNNRIKYCWCKSEWTYVVRRQCWTDYSPKELISRKFATVLPRRWRGTEMLWVLCHGYIDGIN